MRASGATEAQVFYKHKVAGSNPALPTASVQIRDTSREPEGRRSDSSLCDERVLGRVSRISKTSRHTSSFWDTKETYANENVQCIAIARFNRLFIKKSCNHRAVAQW